MFYITEKHFYLLEHACHDIRVKKLRENFEARIVQNKFKYLISKEQSNSPQNFVFNLNICQTNNKNKHNSTQRQRQRQQQFQKINTKEK